MQVVTVSGFKGGTGKTTLATLLGVVATMEGMRVAGFDLDPNTRNFGSILTRRRAAGLPCPDHVAPGHLALTECDPEPVRHPRWLDAFVGMIHNEGYDLLIIDTGSGSTDDLYRAHLLADVVLTPLNESPGDIHGLFAEPGTPNAAKFSYRGMVETARYERESRGLPAQRWRVCRNRVSHLSTRIGVHVVDRVQELSAEVGFDASWSISDRVAHRAIALEGRTVLDTLPGGKLTMSELAGRSEVRALLGVLRPSAGKAAQRMKLAA